MMVSCSAFVYPMMSSAGSGAAGLISLPSSATLVRDGRAADQRRIAMFCFRTIEGAIGSVKARPGCRTRPVEPAARMFSRSRRFRRN